MYQMIVIDTSSPYVNGETKKPQGGRIFAFVLMIILPAIAADIVKKFKGVIRGIEKNNSEYDMGKI